jgi:hypothetical protein
MRWWLSWNRANVRFDHKTALESNQLTFKSAGSLEKRPSTAKQPYPIFCRAVSLGRGRKKINSHKRFVVIHLIA